MGNYKVILFLLPFLGFSQPYVKVSFDPNQALLVVDNPRQKQDVRGLDYDAELGVRDGKFGVYVFGGAFQEIDYQNYGYGVDFYPNVIPNLETSIGVGHGFLVRRFEDDWGAVMAFHFRAVATYFITDHIGIGGRLQYQQRPINSSFGIIEGHIEIKYRFDVR